MCACGLDQQDVGVRIVGSKAFEVDPSSHNTNPAHVFDGTPYEFEDPSENRDEAALEAIRNFVAGVRGPSDRGLMDGQGHGAD